MSSCVLTGSGVSNAQRLSPGTPLPTTDTHANEQMEPAAEGDQASNVRPPEMLQQLQQPRHGAEAGRKARHVVSQLLGGGGV